MPTSLGLDLGPNSVGWALIADSARIIAAGVRIFPEGVDNFDTSKETSRNEQRRLARHMRRQHLRRSRRKRLLREALAQAGLFPVDPIAQATLLETDPYPLRARALKEQLTPHELGRLFYHLNQRRGFLSLRKRERKSKEVSGMLAETQANEQARKDSGHETIGAWLAAKHTTLDHKARADDDHVRNRHLLRSQLEAEFDMVWQRQRDFGHTHLTDELKYGRAGKQQYPLKPIELPDGVTPLEQFGLHGMIFFQRPIYWPASVVGRCTLEPRFRRAPRADRRVQRFRLLQEINNLKYIDPDDNAEKPLTAEQRALLIGKLSTTKEMTFDQIRKALGFIDSVRFNLEKGERGKLKGMTTDALLASKKHVGSDWHKLDDRDKDRIVRNLLDDNEPDERIEQRLVERYGLTPEQAEGAVEADLPSGYADLSLAAINKLLPHLERGLVVMGNDASDSALHAAGYLRPDEQPGELLDTLPGLRDPRCPIADVPNPVVKRALVELRKVVNAIIREHGKPDEIHLEMAREVRQGERQRRDYNATIRDRERDREAAADEIRKLGEKVNREKITRYLLWQEQGGECPYTGRAISQTQIFGGDTDIDHILPYSQSLDDSQMNKVLVFRDANRKKGQRTVAEWLEGDPDRFDAVCQRARKLHYRKYKRFTQKEARQDEFIARQLTDTGYIARATGQYLRCLYDAPHHVLGLKGQLTAELRHQWGLDTVLAEMPDSPAWAEQNKLRPGEKNRADHRHHAIDAIVLALTDRSRLQQLSRIEKQGGTRTTGEVLPDPWNGFRSEVVEAVKKIHVSIRPERKIAGALHEETLYGPTDQPDQWVVRKPVDSLSPNEVPLIRDAGIRQIIQTRLAEHGIEIGRGKKADSKKWKAAMKDLVMPSGVPIKKVRVLRNDKTIQPIRSGDNTAYVKPGSTHHLCIFEWDQNGKPKREAVFVTMLEAINRLRAKQPIIQREPPADHPRIPPNARFVMSLSRGETVQGAKAADEIYVFNTAASTQGQIYFHRYTDARKATDRTKFVVTANSMLQEAKKVAIDPLGRLRWAND